MVTNNDKWAEISYSREGLLLSLFICRVETLIAPPFSVTPSPTQSPCDVNICVSDSDPSSSSMGKALTKLIIESTKASILKWLSSSTRKAASTNISDYESGFVSSSNTSKTYRHSSLKGHRKSVVNISQLDIGWQRDRHNHHCRACLCRASTTATDTFIFSDVWFVLECFSVHNIHQYAS